MKRTTRFPYRLLSVACLLAVGAAGCVPERESPAPQHDSGTPTPTPVIEADAMTPNSYCAIPGTMVATDQGMAIVGEADASAVDLSWVKVPVGYCVHHFANIPETRQLRMSPSGDLFVASPSASTAGGENNPGYGGIVVLPDDDHDGVADATKFYMTGLNEVQGMTFANGYFYFQSGATINRVPFMPGDRAPSGPIQAVTTITAPQDPGHWPKVVDVAQDGTIYVTNGSNQGETCVAQPPDAGFEDGPPARGAVFKVNTDGSNSLVTKGFRNPIALRCEADHDVCLVAELAKDGTAGSGGREKLVVVRQGDNWGFPCCATTNTPYTDVSGVLPANCASVTPENVSFEIGHTPFGLDFEMGLWADVWARRVFVAMHGDVGSFIGSRVVAIALDPATGQPLTATDMPGTSQAPNMMDFVTGWDDGTQTHGRATAVAFGNDGRLYVGDDTRGEIFWVAPVGLQRPTN